MQTIAYTDSRFNYLGRWFNATTGKQSGWQGSQIQFKVSGTATIQVVCDVADTNVTQQTFLVKNEDSENWVSPDEGTYMTTAAEIFTGEKIRTFTLADSGEHTIILKVAGNPDYQWDATVEKAIFKSIGIDDSAVLSEWTQGSTIIGCIGDSWLATTNDWPMLLDLNRYSLWPISFGGASANIIDGRIDFMYSAVAATGDPVMDTVVIALGVNDYIALTTPAAFETSLDALVDKVRVQQPTAPIFLVQIPDNTGTGDLFGQYGPSNAAVAASKDNVYYISVENMGAVTWLNEYHLTFSGRQILADHVAAAIEEEIGYLVVHGSTKEFIAPIRITGKRVATVYDGTTPYSYKGVASIPTITSTPTEMLAYVSR